MEKIIMISFNDWQEYGCPRCGTYPGRAISHSGGIGYHLTLRICKICNCQYKVLKGIKKGEKSQKHPMQ